MRGKPEYPGKTCNNLNPHMTPPSSAVTDWKASAGLHFKISENYSPDGRHMVSKTNQSDQLLLKFPYLCSYKRQRKWSTTHFSLHWQTVMRWEISLHVSLHRFNSLRWEWEAGRILPYQIMNLQPTKPEAYASKRRWNLYNKDFVATCSCIRLLTQVKKVQQCNNNTWWP